MESFRSLLHTDYADAVVEMIKRHFSVTVKHVRNVNVKQRSVISYAFVTQTRMVQLPATAAIEYVAASWVSRARGAFVHGDFFPGGLLAGRIFVRGAYARSPQVQCVYAPSRLSVPSIIV